LSPRVIRNVSYDFSGQVVLITGGGRGQGRSHARAFAAAGATVVVADIGVARVNTVPYDLTTTAELEAVAEEINAEGGNARAIVCDVRDHRQVKNLIDTVIAEFGQIDILINNAGVLSLHEAHLLPEEAWDVMIDTHLKGAFLMSRAVANTMIERGAGGRIICTGSINSLVASPREVHYTTAKHGMVGLAKSFALELAKHGVTVNVVAPGGVDTPMVAGVIADSEGKAWMDDLVKLTGTWNLLADSSLAPEEITNAMLWLASDAAAFVTGATLVVDAGRTIK
jgi:NAD(P)-dependent dehydrogenase (short-subunit alcohol dehydrogenase family)